METGEFPRLPIEFDGDAVTDEAFGTVEDPQLLAAHEELIPGATVAGS
jgi:hypothetical protein